MEQVWSKCGASVEQVKESKCFQHFHFKPVGPLKKLFDQAIARITLTYRGLGRRHLQSYLDEACYRINLTLQDVPIFDNLSHLCLSTKRHHFTQIPAIST